MSAIKDVDLTSREFRADPYPLYARWRAETPVVRTTLADKQIVWIVTRYDDVLTVLKDERFGKDKTKGTLARATGPAAVDAVDLQAARTEHARPRCSRTTHDYADWCIRRSRRG